MGKMLVGMTLLLLIAGAGEPSGDDLIVLQDGSRRIGKLEGCLNGGCQLSDRAIPQTTIAWIGLHQAAANPPRPNDPAVAEVRMIDRSVHPGLMTAIDPTRVITATGTYDRQTVAWVYLTHPAKPARDAPAKGSRAVRFDVSVAVTSHQHYQSSGAVEDDSVDWTGSWQDVSLRVVTGPDGKPYFFPDLPWPTGVVQASAKFTYNDPPTRYQPTNCKGELPTQTYAGTFAFDPKLYKIANKVFLITQARDAGTQFFDALRAVVKARCAPGDFKVTGPIPGTFSFRAPNGIGFDPLLLTLKLNWDLAPSSPSDIPFPLDDILAGKSFTIETGIHSQAVGDAAVDEAVRVSFTAR